MHTANATNVEPAASASPARLFAREGPWLFSRGTDLAVFGGSALAAWVLLALGWALGVLDADAPDWTFFACVIAIDVAHVWSSGFRAYFDAHELRAQPWLYAGLPALAYLFGLALHALSALTFWRALAYLAVFHFLRQQAGFMRLYARRNPAQTPLDTALEQGTLYASMIVPLIYWHGRLPRHFAWLLEGDFIDTPALSELARAAFTPAAVVCGALCAAFVARQLWLGRRAVPGKSVLLAATASCWWLGIVVFDSDYAFTVTNVVIHGVPYFVLTHRYARAQAERPDGPSWASRIARRGLLPCVSVCLVLALAEEAMWDRWVWHEHSEYFGQPHRITSGLLTFLVPLLALPQATHYLLDGFVWRVRRENPVLRRELESG